MAVLLAGAAVGHAQEAQQQKTPQSANAAAATSAATPVAAKPAVDAPKSSADTRSADSGLSSDLLKEARDDGFKPVKRGETTLYCKSEIIVGSSFPVHTCVDSDHLKLTLEQYRAQRMQLEQMHSGGLQGH